MSWGSRVCPLFDEPKNIFRQFFTYVVSVRLARSDMCFVGELRQIGSSLECFLFEDLSTKLKENHLYITGSLFEPSGNHHIEGAQCGLPLLFIDSGGTTEYCKNSLPCFNFSYPWNYLKAFVISVVLLLMQLCLLSIASDEIMALQHSLSVFVHSGCLIKKIQRNCQVSSTWKWGTFYYIIYKCSC